MADPNPGRMIDDEDLEDGEIETDEDNDSGGEETKKASSAGPDIADATKKEAAQNAKLSDDEVQKILAKPQKAKPKIDSEARVDDFMGDVQDALAKALMKDGITPKPIKIIARPVEKETKEPEKKEAKEPKAESSSVSKSSKRRKHKSDKDPSRKKAKMAEEDNGAHAPEHKYESEDFDEYEMMNVRGGSPTQHGGQRNMLYYGSDSSYSSYDSYDSNERRRSRRRKRGERNSRRNHRAGNSSKREKRRREDSDDEDMEGAGNHNMAANNMGNQNHNRNNHHNNQPRKAELCKFYLMECCAKGEKCLYMHGDFPCKFYYLGMKGHNRETCKFSHGRPLTDHLRALLLKHLETAPKEILGDFPRLPRETAINMLNVQHQKLLAKFGMETESSAANASSAQSSKLPSLLDLNFAKFPPPNDMAAANSGNSKKDKPRKSRWCEQRGESEASPTSSAPSSSSSAAPPPAAAATTTANSSKKGAQTSAGSSKDDIKLSSLGDFTPEQVNKLAKMGIETINQITQLTVLQIIELGLSIALISELQLKAAQLQQNKQQSTKQQDSPTEPDTPFSPRVDESERHDHDMRIPISDNNRIDQDTKQTKELDNQDVDMRVLTMGMRPMEQKKHKKTDAKTSRSSNDRPTAHSHKTIDYSQYLKDANIDLDQSDLDDPIAENSHKEKKKSYDSDEDEANPLVIEEEDNLHIDEPDSENEDNNESSKSPIDRNENTSSPNPNSNSNSSNANDEPVPPAFYAPSLLFPTSVTNKIDLSSSVSQLLKKETQSRDGGDKKTDSNVGKNNEGAFDSNMDSDATGAGSPPSKPHGSGSFEFFSRQIPETNHPAPQALDEKTPIDYDSEDEPRNDHSPLPLVIKKTERKSIYDISSDDDSDGVRRESRTRTPSDDDNEDSQDSRKANAFSLSKDKDMRISAMFMDKDYSNGDIDLRLPFKPVMANYIPATEIDASITSHPPIVYSVKEVDIPKPDYSELRKSIPTHEHTLDPRLRKILRLKDDYVEPDNSYSPNSTPFSPPHSETESALSQPNPFSVARSVPDSYAQPKSDLLSDPRRARSLQSSDPRRGSTALTSVLNHPNQQQQLQQHHQQSTTQRSLQMDIHNILQKSNWYKDCSSKQKIMVNQQLAIVSTELKKFHANTSENKIFDLKFINQNPLLQEVLTNLDIFINEDGEFVQLDQPMPKEMQARLANANAGGLVDLMSIPIGNRINDLSEYLRNQQQQQQVVQQQQQQMQQALMGNARFLAGTNPSQMLGFGGVNLPADVIRPGLLGIAPPLPHMMQNVQNASNFFNRGSGNANSGRNTGNQSNRRDMRRNFDNRSNARREKK